MAPSIAFWSGKKWAYVGTEIVCSVPVSVFIKSYDGSMKSFSEFLSLKR